MAIKNVNEEVVDPWEVFQGEVRAELEQSQRALREIRLMLEQSQVELSKITQRNNSITSHLQHTQSQLESLPRGDIKMAYDSALDAQQRLFVMRGQLEKLNSDQNYLQQHVSFLERTLQLIEGGHPSRQGPRGNGSTTLEMLINAQETERQRLSRQMHDGPAQALSNFILQTEIAMRLFDVDPNRAKDELTNLKLAAMETFQKVRSFIFDLRPMMLDDLGLLPTVKRYVETVKEQSGMDVSLVATGLDRRSEPYIEIMIFRFLQELLSNSLKVSQATQVKVQMNIEESTIRISVDDNGKGFDEATIAGNELGIKLIRERVEMVGGNFDVDSMPGQGTRITFQIPFVKN